MGELLLLLAFVGASVAIARRRGRRGVPARRATKTWPLFAARRGWRSTNLSQLGVPRLASGGDPGDLRVSVTAVSSWPGQAGTCVEVGIPRAVGRGLSLTSRGLLGVALPAPPRALRLGDPAFDVAVQLVGDEAEALTWLDAPTRRAITHLCAEAGVRLTRETLRCEFPTLEADVDRLGARVDQVMAVAEALTGRGDIDTSRLAERAASDPAPGVRAGAVRMLGRRYPGSPDHRATVTTALLDPDIEVVSAAIPLTAAADAPRLVELASDRELPDGLRADAVGALAHQAPPDVVAPAMRRWLADLAGLSRAPTFASAVLETTVRAALPHCASLVAAAVGSAPTPLATTATSAMAEVESEPLYEGALLGLLRRNDHALVAASLSALARHGSVDAVRVIRKFDLPARWDRAVRQTIDTIHERAGTPAAGGLALSSPPIQSGGLSLEGSRN